MSYRFIFCKLSVKSVSNFRASKILVSLLIVLLVLLSKNGGQVNASAGNASTITTSPISISLSGLPGSKVSTVLHLQNNSNEAVDIGIKLEKFDAKGDNGQANIYNPSKSDISRQWVSFSQNSFIAQPGVWNSDTMTISLPKTAAFGYYYAVLFYPETPLNTLIPSSNTVKGANAILILVNALSPNATTNLKVQSFSVAKSSNQYLPVGFNLNVRNVGNVFTAPSGDIYISRTPNGPSLDTLDINKGGGNILPGTNRVFSTVWADGFPVYQDKILNGAVLSNKSGAPIRQLKWNLNKISDFRFGEYYAKLVLVYNDGSRDIPVTSEVSFWVVPWLLITVIILAVALVGVGVWTISKGLVRKFRPKKNVRRW
jgi:hypothetical protein